MGKISVEWLKEKNACTDGIEWFVCQDETDGLKVIEKLIIEKQLSWANWLIVRIMNYKQYVSYAVFAAEQVIDIYEKRNPDDKRPRLAIEAAKKCLDYPSKENKVAAAYAASTFYASASFYAAYAATAFYASYAATDASYAASYAAAYAASYAAYAAADSAAAFYAAAYAAYAAADSAAAAFYAAADAAYAANNMRLKILNYGISLLEGL